MKKLLLFLLLLPMFLSAQVIVIGEHKFSKPEVKVEGVIVVGDGDIDVKSQSSYAPVFSWLTRSTGTPCKDWESQSEKIFFAPVDKFRFSRKLFRQKIVNKLRKKLKNYPRTDYLYKWCATADLEVGVYDNLSKAQRASKLDELNSQHTFSWLRLSQIVDEFGSDAERDRLVERAEQRGIYLYVIPRPKRPEYISSPPVEAVRDTLYIGNKIECKDPSWFHTYVEYSHDAWGRETTKPVNRHELGVYAQGSFFGTWIARLAPVVYKGIVNFNVNTHEYTAGSASLKYSTDLGFVQGFVRGTIDYSYENNEVDEIFGDAGLRLSFWRLYAEGSGHISQLKPLFGIRDSSAYFQKFRGRIGVEFWDDVSFGYQLSYSYYNDVIQERDHKPYSPVENGIPFGIFFSAKRAYCIGGLRITGFLDLSYERTFYSRRWKETNFWEDPMVGIFDNKISLTINF